MFLKPERFICVDKDYKDCRNFDHKHKKMEAPVEDRVTPPWHTMTKEEVLEEMGLNPKIRRTGLTAAEAAARLEQYGMNQMTAEEKVTIWQKIWHLINNVLVGILVFVAIVSSITAIVGVGNVVQNWIQVGIIVAVIV